MISKLCALALDKPATCGQMLILGAAILSLGGAWYLQMFGGLFPCPLCLEQRIPWYIASGIAAATLAIPILAPHAAGWRMWALLPNMGLMLWSAYLGAYHVGVEHQWWGSACTGPDGEGGGTATIEELMAGIATDNAVPCDAIQWEFFGITLAAMNMVISLGLALILGSLFMKALRASQA